MRDDRGQLQLLESVMVALFIFIAIAVMAVYRLPSTPDTFARSELESVANDALRVRQAKTPGSTDDCNESSSGLCPYSNDLERLISLGVGARGYVKDTASTETADATELASFLDQALPAGARYRIGYGNGVTNTIITPTGVEPPAAPVVVARTLLMANWTKFARDVSNTTILRIGETTGFGSPTNITDPMNRDANETGVTWLSSFATVVPDNAVYGTHRVCYVVTATECTKPWYNVTVVPPSANGTVYGAGSQILPGDFNTTTFVKNITTGKSLQDLLYLYDDPGTTAVRNDAVYVHLNHTGSAVVQVGDLRVTRVAGCRGTAACHAGSYVRTADVDVGRAISNVTNAAFQARVYTNDASYPSAAGTKLYVLKSGSNVLAGDIRLSRVGVYQAGSRVVAGQSDVNAAQASWFKMDRFYVKYSDNDNDGKWDEGEPVFLDYNRGTADRGIETYNHYLSQVGEPANRNPYDIKLEVWYGV